LGLAVGISATKETAIDSVLTQNVETFCTYVVLHAWNKTKTFVLAYPVSTVCWSNDAHLKTTVPK
jgi:hypothetical protein